jgi:hypothetical protein
MSTVAASLRRLVPRRWLPASLFLTLTGAVLLAGSGLIAARAAHPSDDLVSIAIAPASVNLVVGASRQFQVSGLTRAGLTVVPSVTWVVTGGTITSAGLYQAGTTAGLFQVVAVAAGGISDTATVTVKTGMVGATGGEDQVRLDHLSLVSAAASIPPSLPTVVLLNATAINGTCWKNEKRSTSLLLGNLGGTNPLCPRDEIAVFSVDDPFVLDTSDAGPGGIWTPATGDVRTEDLRTEMMQEGPRVVTLALWYLTTDAEGKCQPVDEADGEKATQLYNANRVGVIFVFSPPMPACTDQTLTAGGTPPSFACPGTSRLPDHFTRGAINVYYVPSLGDYVRGLYCPRADPHIILISQGNYSETTLAHELGHAFGLSHTYDELGQWFPGHFGNDNLMWSDWVARSTFSLGQAFRVNVEELSRLNRDLIRTGPVRQCECRWGNGCTVSQFQAKADQDGICPRISAKWQ